MIRIPGTIPINIHPVFWILCFGIGFINTMSIAGSLIWAVVIFISILIHEFGHALSAIAFNQVAQIDLIGLGGMTSRRGPRLKLWQEFVIVACGPLAGFALAGLAFLTLGLLQGGGGEILQIALQIALIVNIFWTIVNLLPVQPLDGGHLLRIILEGAIGVRGVKAAHFISIVVAGAIAILAFVYAQILIGAIMFMLAFESYRQWQGALAMTATDQNEGLQDLLKEAEQDVADGRLYEAEQKLHQVRTAAQGGVLFSTATVYLAQILMQQEKYVEAYGLLKPLQKKLDSDALPLLHQLAYKSDDWRVAADMGNETYQVNPSYQTALINAFCYAKLGEAEPAVGWLKRSISDGLPNLGHILQRDEFDHIRNDPRFIDICNINISS